MAIRVKVNNHYLENFYLDKFGWFYSNKHITINYILQVPTNWDKWQKLQSVHERYENWKGDAIKLILQNKSKCLILPCYIFLYGMLAKLFYLDIYN